MDDMTILFVAGLAIGFIIFVSLQMPNPTDTTNLFKSDGTPHCPPHRWKYVNDTMICSQCNKRPEL